MRRNLAYLRYVLRHKWFVFVEAIRLGVPLWIAIVHDWDKFLPDGWIAYSHTFYDDDGTQFKKTVLTIPYSLAWKNHQHRNKHHWQYWCRVDGIPIQSTMVMIWDSGQAQGFVGAWDETSTHRETRLELHDVPAERITCDPMSELYMREMLADWRGAGKAQGKPDTVAWYRDNRDKMKLHPDTRAWFDERLGYQNSGD